MTTTNSHSKTHKVSPNDYLVDSTNNNNSESIVSLSFMLLLVVIFILACVIISHYCVANISLCINNDTLYTKCRIYLLIMFLLLSSIAGVILQIYYYLEKGKYHNKQIRQIRIAGNILCIPIYLAVFASIASSLILLNDKYQNLNA